MKANNVKRVGAVFLAAALLLSSCASGGEESGTSGGGVTDDYATPGFFGEESGEPVTGGTLTFADYTEARTLDPAKGLSSGFAGTASHIALYDQLIRWNERTEEFEPRLAEAVEPNADFTEWTIKVRPNVKFSDGTPLDADAVVGSINYYVENRGYDMGVVAPFWEGVKKVDDMTVVISLNAPWATFQNILGLAMGMIVAPAGLANGPDGFQPIGAGAFVLDEYKPQEELTLAANPDHWGGRPYLDSLRFVWLGADQTKAESLEGGAVHVALVRDAGVIKDLREQGVGGWVAVEGQGSVLMINQAEDRPGHDPRVRQAMAHAIDPEAVNQRSQDGLGIPTKRMFTEKSRWYNPDAPVLEFDPEKASVLVEEAKADGFDGHVQMVGNSDPRSRDEGLAIQAQLEAVGFTVDNQSVRSPAELINQVYVNRDFDTARSAMSLPDSDPYQSLFSLLNSESGNNPSGVADPELDALIDELRTKQGDDRGDVLKRIETRYLEEAHMVTLRGNIQFVAWSDDVRGVVATNKTMTAYDKAWIATE